VQGDTLTSQEVTGVFFGVTKLFRAQDIHLRRCVWPLGRGRARGRARILAPASPHANAPLTATA
jgi:hypothetical protein